MTNEELVEKIRNGVSITADMELLYENNLPLIRKLVRPYTAKHGGFIAGGVFWSVGGSEAL